MFDLQNANLDVDILIDTIVVGNANILKVGGEFNQSLEKRTGNALLNYKVI